MTNITRRAFFKTCAYSFFALGLGNLPLKGMAEEFNIPVLCYHRVGYTDGPLTVTPERLAGDLSRLLGNGYTPITLQQFEGYILKQKDNLPQRPVLLTFDDGYRDNYDFAFPVLQKYGVPAVFYIITNFLNDRARLSSEQIREMAKYQMGFGSHTVSHKALAELPPETVSYELNASKLVLEDVLGHEVTALSYPRGSYNAAVIRIAGECGYLDAVTVRQGICTRWLSPLEMPRVPIFSYHEDVLERINRAY